MKKYVAFVALAFLFVGPASVRVDAKLSKQYADIVRINVPSDSSSGATLYRRTIAVFPKATLCDMYKSAFQDFFGPAHLITDSATCAAYIRSELQQLSPSDVNPLIDTAGFGTNYYRVNLTLVRQNVIPLSVLVGALIRSAQTAPVANEARVAQWRTCWESLMVSLPPQARSMTNFSQDSTIIADMLCRGSYVMHHSQQFNEHYNYHYRIVSREVYIKDILPLMESLPN